MKHSKDKTHQTTLMLYNKYQFMQNCWLPERAIWHFKHKAYDHVKRGE